MTKPLKPYIYQEGDLLCDKCTGPVKRPLNHIGKHTEVLSNFSENTCFQCGKVFLTVPSRKHKYCSVECAWASKDRVATNPQNIKQPKRVKLCATCNKEFTLRVNSKDRVFCSPKCMGIHSADPAKKLVQVCPVCSKSFQTWKSNPTTHCSRKCFKKNPETTQKFVKTRTENGTFSAKFNYSRSLRGVRRGQYFRSKMEANYAAYLDYLGIKWEYEPKTFWFPVKRGCVSYTPDFYLPEQDKFVETKGWMDDRSKTKIKRMRIYHPKVKLEVVTWKDYELIARKASEIPNWEFTGKRAV